MGVIDFWANIGVDAFRLDAMSHLIKREGANSKSLPETHAMLRKIRGYLNAKWPDRPLLVEAHEPVQKLKEYFGNNDEAQLVYNFPLAEKIFLALKRNRPEFLSKTIISSLNIPADCLWAVFLRNHDELSLATLTAEEREEFFSFYDPENKYKFGTGVSLRVADLLKNNRQKIIEAFELLFSLPGIPVIYFGDEIGMVGQPLAPGEKDTRRVVRGEMDWKLAEAEIEKPDSIFTAVSNLAHAKITRPAIKVASS